MSIESIEMRLNEEGVDSGVSFVVRKMCSLLAVVDFGLLGMHLGLDRYGPHNLESSMFLWDPVNYNPEKKQKVQEIYAPGLAENKYLNAALHIAAVPSFVFGLVLYPIEKTAEHFPTEYFRKIVEKIDKKYSHARVYSAVSKYFSFDETETLELKNLPPRVMNRPADRYTFLDELNAEQESKGPVTSALQNLLK